MNFDARVLSLGEIDEIMAFEAQQLAQTKMTEVERVTAGWDAKWRREALEFYLPLGWSFAVRQNSELKGYFLAQPLLFFRGQTQSLWIEHLTYTMSEVRSQLVELAVRWGRDKHLQRVLFADLHRHKEGFGSFTVTDLHDDIGEVKTTKG